MKNGDKATAIMALQQISVPDRVMVPINLRLSPQEIEQSFKTKNTRFKDSALVKIATFFRERS